MNLLPTLFRSNSRATVLRTLFGPHERVMYLSELTDITGMASRSVEVELKNLKALGLLMTSADRSRIYYSANKNHPIYNDLRSIVQKTAGALGRLQEALAFGGVEFAFLINCPPEVEEIPGNAHLFIVRKDGGEDTVTLTEAATVAAGWPLPTAVLSLETPKPRFSGDPSILPSIDQPKTFVIGREDRFQAVLGLDDLPPFSLTPKSSP